MSKLSRSVYFLIIFILFILVYGGEDQDHEVQIASTEAMNWLRGSELSTGADWLYFSARALFDQTGPQIVENVNQWAEIHRNANVSILSRTFSLRASSRIARPASLPMTLYYILLTNMFLLLRGSQEHMHVNLLQSIQ